MRHHFRPRVSGFCRVKKYTCQSSELEIKTDQFLFNINRVTIFIVCLFIEFWHFPSFRPEPRFAQTRNLFRGDAKTTLFKSISRIFKKGQIYYRSCAPTCKSGVWDPAIVCFRKLVQRTVWENLDEFKWLKLKFMVHVIKFYVHEIIKYSNKINEMLLFFRVGRVFFFLYIGGGGFGRCA